MLTVNQRLKTGAVGFPFEKVPHTVENCPPSNMEVDKGLPQQDSSLPTPFRQLPCLLEGVIPLTGRLTRARPKVQRCVAQTSCLGAPSAGGKAHCSQKQSRVPSAEQILPPSRGVVDLRVRVPFEDSYSGGGLERKPAGKCRFEGKPTGKPQPYFASRPPDPALDAQLLTLRATERTPLGANCGDAQPGAEDVAEPQWQGAGKYKVDLSD